MKKNETEFTNRSASAKRGENASSPPVEAQVIESPRACLEQLQTRIREIDEHIASLRDRHSAVREDLATIVGLEERVLRVFAESDKQEKTEIEQQLSKIAHQRATTEREAKALAIALAETEEERRRIYPEFEQLQTAEQCAERKRKIEELRQAHENDQRHERECDQALLRAREASERSFFAWRTAVDREFVEKQMAAWEVAKTNWPQIAGTRSANGPELFR